MGEPIHISFYLILGHLRTGLFLVSPRGNPHDLRDVQLGLDGRFPCRDKMRSSTGLEYLLFSEPPRRYHRTHGKVAVKVSGRIPIT